MNRRDLILGSALSLAAGAVAHAQEDEAPRPGGEPAGGVLIPGDRGDEMVIMFTTSTNLNDFMPPGLTCVDPHRAFIKGQRKKGGGEGSGRPGLQIGLTTIATTPKFGPRHRNILMWQSSPAGIASTLVGVKRWGDSEMTHIFEQDRKLVAQGSPVPFYLDVQQHGHSLMSFAGVLDGKKRIESPPYNGMYIGGEPGADLLSLTFDNTSTGRQLHGTGTLSFGSIPVETAPANPSKNWPATLLKDIKVEGCVYEELTFTRTYGSEFETVRKALPYRS